MINKWHACGFLICPNLIPIDEIPFSTAYRSTPLITINDAFVHLERKQIILGYKKKKKKKKKERKERKKGKRKGGRERRMKEGRK